MIDDNDGNQTGGNIGKPDLKVVTIKPKKPAEKKQKEVKPEDLDRGKRLIDFCLSEFSFCHDKNAEVYGICKRTGEVRRVNCRAFRDALVARYFNAKGQPLRQQNVNELIMNISGIGRHQGKKETIFLRFAKHGDKYYVDLAQPGNSRAVEIDAYGWRVLDRPPVLFERTESMAPMETPDPTTKPDFSALMRIANIPKGSELLVIAWLIEAMRIDTPYPVLELFGEQGSAKSTTQSALRELIDPNSVPLRATPKGVDDLIVSASASAVVSIENASHLSPQVQDAFCILATGGGFSKRRLYSDSDEYTIEVNRPVIVNGIAPVVTQQDLVDRAVSIELPRLINRISLNTVKSAFMDQLGAIRAALFDCFARALAELPNCKIPQARRPRLIEFALLGLAVEKVLGYSANSFLISFESAREEAVARTLENSAVATALASYMRGRSSILTVTAGELSELIRPLADRGESWPRSQKALANELRRVAPALRLNGISCESVPKTGGVIRWKIAQL